MEIVIITITIAIIVITFIITIIIITTTTTATTIITIIIIVVVIIIITSCIIATVSIITLQLYLAADHHSEMRYNTKQRKGETITEILSILHLPINVIWWHKQFTLLFIYGIITAIINKHERSDVRLTFEYKLQRNRSSV